jgi:hypothetical protein
LGIVEECGLSPGVPTEGARRLAYNVSLIISRVLWCGQPRRAKTGRHAAANFVVLGGRRGGVWLGIRQFHIKIRNRQLLVLNLVQCVFTTGGLGYRVVGRARISQPPRLGARERRARGYQRGDASEESRGHFGLCGLRGGLTALKRKSTKKTWGRLNPPGRFFRCLCAPA